MQNYTFVTGASTGIGRAIVEEMMQKDHIVFAGARKPKDLQSLKELGPNVIPIELDVTRPEQLQEAFIRVKSQLKTDFRFHLVNNAGVAVPSPMEGISITNLRYQFEVNVIGVVAATQTFLPLIKKNKGRIVMISSVSGRVSTPFLGAYSASKFALEAISDSLRVELRPAGVDVCIVQPGPILTPIWEKNLEQEQAMLASLPPDVLKSYAASLERFKKTIKASIKDAIPAQKVAVAVGDCLTSSKPRLRQVVAAKVIKLQITLAEKIPIHWRDQQMQKNYMA